MKHPAFSWLLGLGLMIAGGLALGLLTAVATWVHDDLICHYDTL